MWFNTRPCIVAAEDEAGAHSAWPLFARLVARLGALWLTGQRGAEEAAEKLPHLGICLVAVIVGIGDTLRGPNADHGGADPVDQFGEIRQALDQRGRVRRGRDTQRGSRLLGLRGVGKQAGTQNQPDGRDHSTHNQSATDDRRRARLRRKRHAVNLVKRTRNETTTLETDHPLTVLGRRSL